MYTIEDICQSTMQPVERVKHAIEHGSIIPEYKWDGRFFFSTAQAEAIGHYLTRGDGRKKSPTLRGVRDAN